MERITPHTTRITVSINGWCLTSQTIKINIIQKFWQSHIHWQSHLMTIFWAFFYSIFSDYLMVSKSKHLCFSTIQVQYNVLWANMYEIMVVNDAGSSWGRHPPRERIPKLLPCPEIVNCPREYSQHCWNFCTETELRWRFLYEDFPMHTVS